MKKTEIISAIAEQTKLSQVDTKKFLEKFLDSIYDEICEGKDVSLHGIGILKPVQRKARTGRNLQTGKSLKIPARTSVKFVLSKSLKDEINGN